MANYCFIELITYMIKETIENLNMVKIPMGGYFVNKDSIIGNYEKCMICKKIPYEIYFNSSRLLQLYHCKNCKKDDFKPRNLWEKIILLLNN